MYMDDNKGVSKKGERKRLRKHLKYILDEVEPYFLSLDLYFICP